MKIVKFKRLTKAHQNIKQMAQSTPILRKIKKAPISSKFQYKRTCITTSDFDKILRIKFQNYLSYFDMLVVFSCLIFHYYFVLVFWSLWKYFICSKVNWRHPLWLLRSCFPARVLGPTPQLRQHRRSRRTSLERLRERRSRNQQERRRRQSRKALWKRRSRSLQLLKKPRRIARRRQSPQLPWRRAPRRRAMTGICGWLRKIQQVCSDG